MATQQNAIGAAMSWLLSGCVGVIIVAATGYARTQNLPRNDVQCLRKPGRKLCNFIGKFSACVARHMFACHAVLECFTQLSVKNDRRGTPLNLNTDSTNVGLFFSLMLV